MRLQKLLAATAALLAGSAVFATAVTLAGWNLRRGNAAAPGAAHLMVSTSRNTAQRTDLAAAKLDPALADLARHAPLARAGRELPDLHDMSPAARFTTSPVSGASLVLVDAVTRGDPQALRAALETLGLERASVYSNDVGGWLPVSRILDAAARPELAAIHAALPRARAASGVLATQGDYVQHSSAVRATYPSLTGTGVTVGVLSDSFDCYEIYAQPGSGVPASGFAGYASNGFTATAEEDEASGALPAKVTVLAEPFTSTPSAAGNCLAYGAPDLPPFSDEGRAMLQIVHAVAPGANLAFYTGDNSEADFANGIGKLAAAGAKVIADDLGYFDEPFFQDGIVAQAIDAVEQNGVAYFSAAGNDANAAWQSTAPSFATPASGATNAGEFLLNFDTSGATTATSLPITLAPLQPGEFIGIVVQWDQPYVTGAPASPGATSRIDVCVTGTSGVFPIVQDYEGNSVTCTGPNAAGVDPVQVLIIGNPASASAHTAQATIDLVIGLADGTPAPGRVIVSVSTDGQTASPFTTYATNSPTLQGHPGAAGAAAVGAAFYFQTPQCGATPAQLEPFSSLGGAPILFDTSGNRLATPTVRQKPNFVGPDGINNTFLGFQLTPPSFDGVTVSSGGELPTTDAQCQNNASSPNFFGTSAATPHAAGIAALMRQANPAATPTQIYAALENSALPMTGSGATPNFHSGYGFIQADTALALLPLGPPSLSLGASSIVLGQSTTLTWVATDATSCTASGNWSGPQASSASITLTPVALGSYTYSLSCTNTAGTTSSTSATLTVTAAAAVSGGGGSGGGGGALGWPALGLLAVLGSGRRRRS